MSPIFHRELLSSFRSPVTWWLRVGVGAAAFGVLSWLTELLSGDPATLGRPLFIALHGGFALILAILAPALTADCVTEERRAGTLGLLLLTPLKPHEVLLGKAQHHGLRLMGAWLAMFPIGLIPIMLGGVGSGDILLAWAIEGGVGVVGLGSGILASASVRHRHQSLWLAYGLAVPGNLVILMIPLLLLGNQRSPSGFFLRQLLASWALVGASAYGVVGLVWWAGKAAVRRWRMDEFEFVKLVPTGVKSWRELHERLGDDWEETLEDLEHRSWGKGPGQKLRQRRPLEWLRLRERGRGELRGLWCGLVFLGWILSVGTDSGRPAQLTTLVLILGMSLRSARGYRDEAQNSTLELLLCIPLPLREVLLSRVRLVLREFLPAVVLQWLFCLWLQRLEGPADAGFGLHFVLPLALAITPAVGLWMAPRVRLFPMAVVCTAATLIAPPLGLAALVALPLAQLYRVSWMEELGRIESGGVLAVSLAALGVIVWNQVAKDFRERRHVTRVLPH